MVSEKVIGNRTSDIFNVIKGKECMVLDNFWSNGESWYKLKDEDGNTFESPDIFWD